MWDEALGGCSFCGEFVPMTDLMSSEILNLSSLNLASLDLASVPVVLGQVNPIVINLTVGAFLMISIVMILIVLIQRPQGGGLGGAFGAGGGGGGGGGGGAGQTAFGTKTGDVLTGGTIAIFVLFLVFAIILNFLTRPPEAQPSQPVLTAPASVPLTEDGEIDHTGHDHELEHELEGAVDPIEDMVDETVVPEPGDEPTDTPDAAPDTAPSDGVNDD